MHTIYIYISIKMCIIYVETLKKRRKTDEKNNGKTAVGVTSDMDLI